MIPKIVRGKGFGGLLRYAFGDGKNADIVCTNMIGIDPQSLAEEFREIASRRAEICKPVWHCSLSLSPSERLPTEGWDVVVRDYLARVGFPKDAAFVAVRHNDKEHDHVHIIASRVNPDGTVFLGKWEAAKAIRICRQLEKDYHLIEVKQKNSLKLKSGEFKQMVRTQELPARLQVKDILQDVVNQKPQTMSEFVQLALDAGLEVIPNISKTTGKLNGFAFGLDGVSFKASQIGKEFTVAKLLNSGISYERERDGEFLKQLAGKVVIPEWKPSPVAKEKSDLLKRYQADREEQWKRHKRDMFVRLDEINSRIARRKAAAEKLFKDSMRDAYEIKRGFFRDSFRDEMHDLYIKTLKEIYEDANAERQRLFESQKIEKLNWEHWLELQCLCGDQQARKELQRRKQRHERIRNTESKSKGISEHHQAETRVEDSRRSNRVVVEVPSGIARQNQIGRGAEFETIRRTHQSERRTGEIYEGASVQHQADSATLVVKYRNNDIFHSIECLRALDKADLEKLVRRVSDEERNRSFLEGIPVALRAQLCDRRSEANVRRDDLQQMQPGQLDGQRGRGQMQMPQNYGDDLLNSGGITGAYGMRYDDAVHEHPGFRVVNPMIEEAVRRAIARDPGALQEFARQGVVEIEGQAVERQSKTLTDRAEIAQAKRLRR